MCVYACLNVSSRGCANHVRNKEIKRTRNVKKVNEKRRGKKKKKKKREDYFNSKNDKMDSFFLLRGKRNGQKSKNEASTLNLIGQCFRKITRSSIGSYVSATQSYPNAYTPKLLSRLLYYRETGKRQVSIRLLNDRSGRLSSG